MGCLVEFFIETVLELFAEFLVEKLHVSRRIGKVFKWILIVLLILLLFAAILGILALLEHLFSGLLDVVRFD
ncbi:MAG: hypothetical protein HFE39_06330 [Clostridiales bacterium]|jgi:L-cystine uptake protein TcyP (sodium:dicarboxylate symporter family)|nr:hypothetical protein [Clostridiales bacterium]